MLNILLLWLMVYKQNKDIAYFVTKDIEDDGIAYALEKLDLI